MNKFGTLFTVQIFGESHGACVGITIDGCPAGLPLQTADFVEDMERRKGGKQKGTTPRQEDDIPIFKAGLFNDTTTGAPIMMLFENNNTRSGDYEKQRAVPRPGHADFTAHHKFGGFEDYRGGGHFSGRLTAALVGAGVVAKKVLNAGQLAEKIKVEATIISIGGESDVEKGIQKAIDQKDSVGGIVECVVKGLPIGLGEHFFNSVESLISHAVFAIPAIRGIEFGTGFAAASMFGVDHNDSSTPKEQVTLNWETNEQETFSVKGRHDLCIALRVPVVLEAVTAIVLADLMLIDQKIPRIIKK
ncbi:MAG: hypothetical protein RLZZ431_870 [Bacteroidota bacterium]